MAGLIFLWKKHSQPFTAPVQARGGWKQLEKPKKKRKLKAKVEEPIPVVIPVEVPKTGSPLIPVVEALPPISTEELLALAPKARNSEEILIKIGDKKAFKLQYHEDDEMILLLHLFDDD